MTLTVAGSAVADTISSCRCPLSWFSSQLAAGSSTQAASSSEYNSKLSHQFIGLE